MEAQPRTTQKIIIEKLPKLTYRLIAVRGSQVPVRPNDVNEIEVDGVTYEVADFYKINRNETMYPAALVLQAFGKNYEQAELWKMYRRENNIFFFVAKIRE